jgi:hypothetical protein
MKKYLLLVLTFAVVFTANAQYKTMILNYEKSSFGENEPLPTNKNFIINGVVNSNIAYVDVKIFSKKGMDDKTIFSTFWKRDLNSQSLNFNLPINFHLREGKEYDFLIQYFRETSASERKKLEENLNSTLAAYIQQAFKISDKELELVNGNKKTLNDLNKIVTTGLTNYRTRTAVQFTAFSDIVKMKLKQMDDVKLSDGVADKKDRALRVEFKNKMMNELQTLLSRELEQYINNDLYILADDKYIDDYPTEKVQSYLPLNIGYGGALLSTDFSDFNYGAAPYIGLSIPFGKEGGRSAFWSRTSLSVGAFITNLEDQGNVEYTGPIFKIPVYAGLGYRAYRFIRVNAGATFLENTATNNLKIVPFVGLSAEFNISVKLAK